MALVDFRYVRTGTGELSGPSMIHQTEQAFNELGTEIEDIRTDSGDALETAKDALEKAETATSAAASAQQTATEAVTTANAAQATATEAVASANAAQETAQAANATAEQASTEAAAAKATAENALEKATGAEETSGSALSAAQSAQETASDALGTASTAQASADAAKKAAATAQTTADSAQSTAGQAFNLVTALSSSRYFLEDSDTVDIDGLSSLTRLYLTGSVSITLADGTKINAPFWFWNEFSTDGTHGLQYVCAEGKLCLREGTVSGGKMTWGSWKYVVPAATGDALGTVKPDGKTTRAEAGGVITAKDVAIGGDLGDLASARGQIGNSKTQGSHDFSSGMLSEKPGMYTAINSGSTNVPFTGPFAEMILGTPTHRGSLLITSGRPSFPRAAISAIDMREGGGFSGYTRLITEQQIGDGLTNTNGIISVPEYDGATASTAGTSGLVPPAAAGQHESFLTGGGEYKPALTKISDSVSLEDSKTAASAKAVKTAYDLANSKLPISGGTITGGLTINGGLESHQNINLTSDEANGLAIALYNTSNAILSSLRFKNNLITVEKGVFSADGVYSRGNMQLRTDDSNGLAIALYDLDGVSLYNAVRLKKDGTVSLEFQPLDISQGGTGARDAATARTNLFVPARPQNEEGPGQFTAIGVSAAQFTLPSGGSWAYSAIATDSSRLVSVIRSGVDAGGSTIYFGSNIAALFGFCWRWQ